MMKRSHWIGLCLGVGLCFPSMSQNLSDIEKLLESHHMEEVNDDYEEMVNTLFHLATSPLNVNTAHFDSLKMLFFLSDSQIDQLLAFRKKHGNFIHVNELLWVQGIGKKDLENISMFITVGELDTRERLQIVQKRMKHEILLRSRTTYPRQEGYRLYTPDDFEKKEDYERKIMNRFRGPNVGTLLKYKLKYGDQLQAGITLENDPGEAYFTRYQKVGFDFWSAHLSFQSDKKIRRFVLGDYRIQWGQGLVAWGGFSTGKSDRVLTNEKSGKGFVASTSTDENHYLRGLALSFKMWKNIETDICYSSKKTDANIMKADTLSEEDLESVSLFETGYHRSLSECSKKHTLREKTVGMSVRWNTNAFKIGIQVLHYDFSPELVPGDRVYQQYNDTGHKRWLMSVDYKTFWRGIYLFGETARSDAGVWATLHGLRGSLSWLSACILYRRYDKRYVSHYASGFGEYSNTSNEEGIYAGINLTPLKDWKINCYLDRFRFFSARYGATIPGKGWEFLFQTEYVHQKMEHIFRYKQEIRPEDVKGERSVARKKREFRYQLNYLPVKQLELRTRWSMSLYYKDQVNEQGYMIYQDFIYTSRKENLKMQGRIAWFKTDSYQSRIYAYENNVLHGYSFPAFMGEGFRTYLNLSWKPTQRLTFYVKGGFICYPDREAISSGVTEIEGNKLYDVTLQLRFTI